MERIELNADFNARATAHGSQLPWKASPMKGVDRRMIERIGDEVARATTIVRYAPGSQFSAHVHTGGEEFIVLDGVFQDEHGDFPAGTYVRNPPTSSHTPASEDGCTIMVKLWQFDSEDRSHVVSDLNKMKPLAVKDRDHVGVIPLFNDGREDVRVEHWDAGAEISLSPQGGIEIFVLRGGFSEGGEDFAQESWLRLPQGAGLNVQTGADGAVVWIKEGHLAHLDLSAFT